MRSQKMMATRCQCIPFVLLALLLVAAQLSGQEWENFSQFKASEAHQAAKADEKFAYAITNTCVAKYDRESGERKSISEDKMGTRNGDGQNGDT